MGKKLGKSGPKRLTRTWAREKTFGNFVFVYWCLFLVVFDVAPIVRFFEIEASVPRKVIWELSPNVGKLTTKEILRFSSTWESFRSDADWFLPCGAVFPSFSLVYCLVWCSFDAIDSKTFTHMWIARIPKMATKYHLQLVLGQNESKNLTKTTVFACF